MKLAVPALRWLFTKTMAGPESVSTISRDPTEPPRANCDAILRACRENLAPNGIAAKVFVVEPTGAETEMLLQVGDTHLTLVMHGRTQARPDDTVHLAVEAEHAHVFDQASGRRLS